MKNKKAKGNNVIIIIIILALAIGAYFYFNQPKTNVSGTTMQVYLYDSSGKLIDTKNTFSIVNNVPNVTFVSFGINVCNRDNLTLSFTTSSFTPATSIRPTNTLTISPNQCSSFLTSLLNISNPTYEGRTTSFCANVTSAAIINQRNTRTVTACLNLTILSDSVSNPINPTFNVTVTGGAGMPCIENWTCGAWSTCSSGTQTRVCTDANSCGTTGSKPIESQTCSGFIKGASCGTSGTINDYIVNGCTISIDANQDGNLETFTFQSGTSLNNLITIACSNWGTVGLSNSPEGLTLRYGWYGSSNRLFICREPANGLIVSLQ